MWRSRAGAGKRRRGKGKNWGERKGGVRAETTQSSKRGGGLIRAGGKKERKKRESCRDPREGTQAGPRRRIPSPQTCAGARAPWRPGAAGTHLPARAARQRPRAAPCPRRAGPRPRLLRTAPAETVPRTGRAGSAPPRSGSGRGPWGPESECRLLLPQAELVPDRDPDNDGTKISVSITATGDRGRVPLSAARQAQVKKSQF